MSHSHQSRRCFRGLRSACLLNPLDHGPHPQFDRSFQLRLIILGLETLDRLARLIQRNVVAGDLLGPMIALNKVQQVTFVARVRVVRISIVNAGEGVLKRRLR